MSETLSPQTLAEEAQQAYLAKDYEKAAEQFAAAAEAFRQAGQPLDAAEMQNNSSVAWVQANQPQRALEAVEGTPEIFLEAGDKRRAGLAWGNLGSAFDGLKRWKEAVEAYSQAAALLEEAGEKEARASVLQALSAAQLRLNEPVEALIAMQEAVDARPRSLKRGLLKRLLKLPFRLLGGG